MQNLEPIAWEGDLSGMDFEALGPAAVSAPEPNTMLAASIAVAFGLAVWRRRERR